MAFGGVEGPGVFRKRRFVVAASNLGEEFAKRCLLPKNPAQFLGSAARSSGCSHHCSRRISFLRRSAARPSRRRRVFSRDGKGTSFERGFLLTLRAKFFQAVRDRPVPV